MKIAARASKLSRAQAAEIQALLPELALSIHFVETHGDLDQKTSLRDLEKTDFFTREIDRMLLQSEVRAAIHSAKDLPDPLPEGLCLAALTSGVDPRDALVLREGLRLEDLPSGARIATSSRRREEAVKELRSDLSFCDLRGAIPSRLATLERGEVDGVVVAEAALVRLKLCGECNRYFLPGTSTENQGKLAIVVREDDKEAQELFRPIDGRGKERPWTILHLGLDPAACRSEGRILHYPVIRARLRMQGVEELKRVWDLCTHLLVTSKTTVRFLPQLSWEGKTVLAIGEKTADAMRSLGVEPLIAPFAEQEGMLALLETVDLSSATLCYPRSSLARPLLADYLQNKSAFVIDLYETDYVQPGALPSLDEIDEISFASSSCVEGFSRAYGKELPSEKKLSFQGRLTAETCIKAFMKDMIGN